MKKVKLNDLIEEIDESVLEAVQMLKANLRDPNAKISEKNTTANNLIRMKFSLIEAQRKQLFDRIEIKRANVTLEMQEIKLAEMKKALNPDATEDQKKTYSRVFSPDYKAPDIDDSVSREGL